MNTFRSILHEIIFEADTPAGKAFDVTLLIAIILSVAAVMLESVNAINIRYSGFLRNIEWFFTILFTVEYLARIYSTKKALSYIISFYGIVDFLSIIPTYLSLIIVGSHTLVVIRTIRLLCVFRIFKLAQFIGEGKHLMAALRASRRKIIVFILGVMSLVVITGTLMYMIETEESGFTSIPESIYWAIVTLTTVGYGDIAPQTVLGQILASFVMLMGYAIIAVPTGIVTVELSKVSKSITNTQVCSNCNAAEHDDDAKFCKKCGNKL